MAFIAALEGPSHYCDLPHKEGGGSSFSIQRGRRRMLFIAAPEEEEDVTPTTDKSEQGTGAIEAAGCDFRGNKYRSAFCFVIDCSCVDGAIRWKGTQHFRTKKHF